MTTTTMGILHLIPRPPSHAAPSATLPISRFPCSSRSTTFSPPLPGQKMQTRLRLGSRCAADGAFQLSPEEERDNRILRFREEMDKFDKKYGDGTASRALGVYSRQDTMLKELETTLFRDEGHEVNTYMRQILSKPIKAYDEVGEMAEMVGIRAVMSIRISAMVTANAHLKVDASSEMSFDTVKQIIQTYVSAFVKAAEDACHEKFDRVVIISFIDALGGLAAISHILFKDTLEVVNNIEDSSSHYSPGYDVEALNHELQRNIKEMVTSLTAAPESRACKRLRPALSDATFQVSKFVILITNLRRKALAHAQARNNDKDRGNK